MDLESIFNGIIGMFPEATSYKEVKKIAHIHLEKFVNTLDDKGQGKFAQDLLSLSLNKLRTRNDINRVVALSSISFYLYFVDDESLMISIVNHLERMLPAESRIIVDFIASIFKNISRRVSSPFIPRIYEKCTTWVFSNPTYHALLTSLILMNKLFFCDNVHPLVSSESFKSFIFTSLRSEYVEIQQLAVNLCMLRLSRDYSVEETVKSLINDCIVIFESNSERNSMKGAFLLLENLSIEHNKTVQTRINDIFNIIMRFIQRRMDYDYIYLLILLIKKHESYVYELCCKIFKICTNSVGYPPPISYIETMSELLRVLPKEMGLNVLQTADQYYDKYPNEFSILYSTLIEVRPDLIHPLSILEFIKNNEMNQAYCDLVYWLSIKFPSFINRIINVVENRLVLDVNAPIQQIFVSLRIINNLSHSNQFDTDGLFNSFFDLFQSTNEQIRLEVVEAVFKVASCLEKNNQIRIISQLFFVGRNDISKRVRCSILDTSVSFVQTLFEDERLIVFVDSYLNDTSFRVQNASISLCDAIMKQYPINLLRLFWRRFSTLQSQFMYTGSMLEKKLIVRPLPRLIQVGGEFFIPHVESYTKFFISILNSDYHLTSHNKVQIYRETKYDKSVRSSIISSIIALSPCLKTFPSLLLQLVNSVFSQIYISKRPAFHILIASALKQVFHDHDILSINGFDFAEFHHKILDYVRHIDNQLELEAYIQLLGTIGPFDPYKFNANSVITRSSYDLSEICDPSKRDLCYLKFVMDYLITQLKSNSKSHSASVLMSVMVYIIQSDPTSSKPFLDSVLGIIRMLFNTPDIIDSNSLFHFLRIIVIHVDNMILPNAQLIIDILFKFLENTPPSLMALKTLGSLIFSLKKQFSPFALSTFRYVTFLLENYPRKDDEIFLYLLFCLTLLIIYQFGSPQLFFSYITQSINRQTENSKHAISFLCQVIYTGFFPQLALPSYLMVIQLVKEETELKSLLLQLLYILIVLYHDVLINLPIQLKGIDPNLDLIVTTLSTNSKAHISSFPFIRSFLPVPDPIVAKPKPSFSPSTVSKIFSSNNIKGTISENNWNSWILSLSQDLVLCSGSASIRSCHSLLISPSAFVINLFPLTFLSVWENINSEERKQLSQYMYSVVTTNTISETALFCIASACEVLDRAGYNMFENNQEIMGHIAERAKSDFLALRFYGKLEPDDNICNIMLRIHSRLKRKESAQGYLEVNPTAFKSGSTLESLSMWSLARELYIKQYEQNPQNETLFCGILRCSSKMDDWGIIGDIQESFSLFSKEMKSELGVMYAEAAYSLRIDGSCFLDNILKDSTNSCYWKSIFSLRNGNYSAAEKWAGRGIIAICSDKSVFKSGNYEPIMPLVYYSMVFEEIKQIIQYHQKVISSESLLLQWKRKLSYIKWDTPWLRTIYRARIATAETIGNKLDICFNLFNWLRRQSEWELLDNMYKHIILYTDDPRYILLQAKVRFDRRIVSDLSEFTKLIDTLKDHETSDIYINAVCSYAHRLSNIKDALPLLDGIINKTGANFRAWKYWTYCNLSLLDTEHNNQELFANNSMKGFATLCTIHKPSIHYLCQLCSIFFNYGSKLTDFDSASAHILNLQNESIAQIIPQLVIQFNNPNESIRKIIFMIIQRFAKDHYQALAFPLRFTKGTTNNFQVKEVIKNLEHEHITESKDCDSLVYSLETISRFSVENMNALLMQYGFLDENQASLVLQICSSIYEMYNSTIPAFLSNSINSKVAPHIEVIKLHLDQKKVSRHLLNSLRSLKHIVREFVDLLHSIDIDNMEIPISNQRAFNLSIPGLYSVNRPLIAISDIHHIIKTIPSAQHPRKISMTGSNGSIYKYLLKGGEDLRLDQDLMQLFCLINSILKETKFREDFHIQLHESIIVPISPSSGLIQWAANGKTFYSLIKWFRKLRNMIHDPEALVYKAILPFGKDSSTELTRIQKVEIYNNLKEVSNENELRESIWLMSNGSESWVNQVTQFSQSMALMSIVGNIIGLGDRHPSNLLFMKSKGNVIHIDLSDSFEKASRRKVCKEAVPFRLTRMIVCAMGSSGVNGVFSSTAEYVASILKRNQSTIMSFLDIFVREPVIDATWYENEIPTDTPNEEKKRVLMKKAIGKVKKKINWISDETICSSAREYVTYLIDQATDDYNLSQMFHGWSPYW